MNAQLLAQLQQRLLHIERVSNGMEKGDPELLFRELLEHAASVSGSNSPEYGLAVRGRASHYRNVGDQGRAVEEYSRAIELLEGAGDEALIQLVESLTSVIPLHVQLGALARARDAGRRAVGLIANYASDPDRYAPPTVDGSVVVSHPPARVASLAIGVAEALVRLSLEEGLQTFDSLAQALAGRPVMQLAVLLSRAAFGEAHGEPDSRETFTRAWALASSSIASATARDFPRPAQWAQLGVLALRCGAGEAAREAARSLHELATVAEDAQYVDVQMHALQLDSAIAAATGGPEETESALRRLLGFCRSTFGRDDQQTADAELALGRHLVDHGRAGEAIAMLRHVADVRSEDPEHDTSEQADAWFYLALALDRNGADTESMDYYRFAYQSYYEARGPRHPHTVQTAINLAETARVAHDFESAERWFRIALRDESAGLEPRSARAAHALNNLAETLLACSRADEATPLAESALALRRGLFGEASREYARSLGVVATIAAQRGDGTRLDAAMDEFREASGSDRVELPVNVILAWLEHTGDYERAVEVCGQVLTTLDAPDRPAAGSELPNQRITIRFTRGRMLARLSRWREALDSMTEAFEIETMFLSDEAGHRSQRQVRLMLGESRERIAILLDILVNAPAVSTADVRAACDVIQQRKALETRLLTLQKLSFVTDRALTTASPERVEEVRARLVGLIDSLRRAREAWLAAVLNRARQPENHDGDSAVIARQDRIEFLERLLAGFVGDRSYDWTLLGPTSRTPSVRAGEAVIEYLYVQTPAPRYFAFVVVGEDVHLISLGEAAPIHQALAQLRAYIVDEPPRAAVPDPVWLRRSRFLSNRLLKPLLPWLADARTLYIVPDAELFTLPFDLLPLDDGDLAIDRWTITHLWNGGERAGFNLHFGSPDAPGPPLVISAAGSNDAGSPMEWQFAPLEFAEREGDEIAAKIGAGHVHGAATKAAVIDAVGVEILHFAAHSFWIEQTTDAFSLIDTEAPLFEARAAIADPMFRSGIALDGADRDLNQPTAASPGILFASEALDLDLRDTDLVVLSSCQSGIGDPRPGDGIQGLRRAFRAAGANTVVSTLWKVPDEPTHDLMIDFYDRILAKTPRGQALREAKLALRERFPDDPLCWAGFVLDGWDQPLFRFSGLRGLRVATLSGVGLSLDTAMRHIAEGRFDDALQSLEFVIESDTADDELRAEAAIERAGVLRQTGKIEDALAAYNGLIDNLGTPATILRRAVAERGLTKQLLGDLPGARGDYTSALAAPDLADDHRAWLLVNRGFLLAAMDDTESALEDWNQVLSMNGAPQDQRMMARLNRADLYRRMQRIPEAIADATTLAEAPESKGLRLREQAYLVIALCHLEQEDLPAAIAAVRRHLEARITPAPPDVAQRLEVCGTPAQLRELIGDLLQL